MEELNIKFKKLTDVDKDFMYKTYKNKELSWDERMGILMKKFGKSERTIRKWLKKLGYQEKIEIKNCSTIIEAEKKEHNKDKKIFLITCAQNATPINEGLVKNMESYAEFLDAEILVIPIRYHNPTSIFTEEKDDWWDDRVSNYLSLKRHKLNKNIVILSDVKTQPTDTQPLMGFESLIGEGSGVLAHPRVHMKSLATIDEKPKMLFTTGACTKRNYVNSKRGKIAEFHHCYGFVIVEIEDDEIFYLRQVISEKNGDFCDLYYNITQENGVKRIESVAGLVKGDIHYGSHNKEVMDISFNELIPKINPKEIVLHDTFDAKSINHHEKNDFIKNYLKEIKNENSLKLEIDNLLKWLESIKQYNITVVFSNHDDFLNRYIINEDHRKDIKNAKEYIEFAKILMEEKAPKGLLAYLINEKIPEINCLAPDKSYKVLGWELSVHGNLGNNGSRGSVQQFKKLNTHLIVGHTHSPERCDGCVCVGTNSELKMGYNDRGLSSWVHCDAIIHNNKKVQQIFFIGKNKKYTILQ